MEKIDQDEELESSDHQLTGTTGIQMVQSSNIEDEDLVSSDRRGMNNNTPLPNEIADGAFNDDGNSLV
jgi:hypothetical protein